MAVASRFAVPIPDLSTPNGHFDGKRTPSSASVSSVNTADYDLTAKTSKSMAQAQAAREMPSLSSIETVELFTLAVDNARQGVQSLAGNTRAAEVAKPKVTLDLKNCRLDILPPEVVEIIRPDVERLQLAHNRLRSMPLEFTSCSTLKYLNLRDNQFEEIPKAVFGLPQLEILDLSRNDVSEVPKEIDKMKALRVFAIQHNRIEDLPLGLGDIGTLRMLKVIGNPLNPSLKSIIDGNEDVLSPATPALPNDENERDKIVTKKVIEHLRSLAALRDSGEDSSDGPAETPRAQSRFPVQPMKYGHSATHSTSGSESASDLKSPAFTNSAAPSRSNSRSHFRAPSFQNNNLQASTSSLRRPGLAPLALGNERNRSNSESLLQATQVTKNKRMGMVPKKTPDLGVLDESRAHRNSHHFRGQSHGSALRTAHRPGEGSPPDTLSPKSYRDGTFVRRLSSVPEQKQDSLSTDKIIEVTKSVLFSLHLIHPQLSPLMAVVKDPRAKRSSLERVYSQAFMHLQFLDDQLHMFDTTQRRGKRQESVSKKTICRAAHACVVAYQQVRVILSTNIKQLVRDGDQKYIRTLLIMLYGSTNEARNARRNLYVDVDVRRPSQTPIALIPATNRVHNESLMSDRANSTTSTQERPKPPEKEKRWRNGSLNQQPAYYNGTMGSSGAQTAVPYYNGTTGISGAQTAVPYVNGRSRSSSRAGGFHNSTASSISSIASTPHSGESFNTGLLAPRSRSGSVARPDRAYQAQIERDQFEHIFFLLNKMADQGLALVYQLEPHLNDNLEHTKKNHTIPRVKELSSTMLSRIHVCAETSDMIKGRLARIKLNDPDTRNAPEFWIVVHRFLTAWEQFLMLSREARKYQVIDDEVKRMLLPIHRLNVENAQLIDNSVWKSRFTTAAGTDQSLMAPPSVPASASSSRAPTPVQNGLPPPMRMGAEPPPPTPMMRAPSRSQSQSRGDNFFHRRPAGTKGSNESNTMISPASYTPATPLSAALGPAAQATVPSTPSIGQDIDRSFQGNFFQRADYYQQSTARRIV